MDILKSNCCQSPIKTFLSADDGVLFYVYVCTECHTVCGAEKDEPLQDNKTLYESAIGKIDVLIKQVESLSQRVNALTEIQQKTLLDEFAMIGAAALFNQFFNYKNISYASIPSEAYNFAQDMLEEKQARNSKKEVL